MDARILLVDDHEVVRHGLRALLENVPGWVVCGEAGNGRQGVAKALELKPDIVVLDIGMTELNGLEAARLILKNPRRTTVIVLSAYHEEAVVREVVALGVRGYVLKSEAARDLILAVEAVLQGRPFFSAQVAEVVLGAFVNTIPGGPAGAANAPGAPIRLTAREREVLQLLAEGHSTKEVAASLGVGIKTAATHRTTVMKKLGARSVSDLVRYAVRNHIVEP